MAAKNFIITLLLCCGFCLLPAPHYAQLSTATATETTETVVDEALLPENEPTDVVQEEDYDTPAVALAPTTVYTVKTVPNVQLQDATAYTTDPQQILPAESVARLNALAAGIRSETGVQLAVVVLPLMSDDYADAREFAHELFNYWGLGEKGKDNGLLVLLITDKSQREITFEVGYGLEGTLPDGLCKLIQTRLMVPLMKMGDYSGGLVAGVEEIQKVLNNSSDVKALYEQQEAESDRETATIGLVLLIVIVLINIGLWKHLRKTLNEAAKKKKKDRYKRFVEVNNSGFNVGCLAVAVVLLPIGIFFAPLLIAWAKHTKRLRKQVLSNIKCENCGEENTTVLVSKKTENTGYYRETTYTFKCNNCGHEHQEKELKNTSLGSSGGSSGGSSRRSSSSGSSRSSGGSWGGGSSGGGGASTRF